MTLVLGVDGGGSKTTAAIMNESGRILGTGTAGSSNFDDNGFKVATANLGAAVQAAIRKAKLEPQAFDAVFLGLGGVLEPRPGDRHTHGLDPATCTRRSNRCGR